MASKTSKTKTRKSMSASTKGVICLAVLLAITVGLSVLSMAGMKLDSEGVNILLPWVPVSSENWPDSLFLSRELGGGNYYEYAVTAAEGEDAQAIAQSTADAMTARLRTVGERDAAVRVKDGGVVRVEVRHMSDEEFSNLQSVLLTPGVLSVTFSDDSTEVLTNADFKSARLSASAAGDYTLTLTLTKEGQEKLTAAQEGRESTDLSLAMDGQPLYATVQVKKNQLTAPVSSYYLNLASNMAFFVDNGAIDHTLTQHATGEMTSSGQGTLRVILIVSALLLAAALVCMFVKGKLTGLAAFWAVWCAVLTELFFFTTIVLTPFNLACAVALLVGFLLAIYTADARVDAVKKQLNEGSTPRQALKFGFQASAKNVWIAHGIVLAIGLILMIFRGTEPFGNCLAAGVTASAFGVLLMRLFLYCFTMLSKKPELFGKSSK